MYQLVSEKLDTVLSILRYAFKKDGSLEFLGNPFHCVFIHLKQTLSYYTLFPLTLKLVLDDFSFYGTILNSSGQISVGRFKFRSGSFLEKFSSYFREDSLVLKGR